MNIVRGLLFLACFLTTTSFFQSRDFNYDFNITVDKLINGIPDSLTIQITNDKKNEIQLHNLILNFYLDSSRFLGVSNKIRFLEKPLILEPTQQFSKTIAFEELTFINSENRKTTSVDELKCQIKSSKILKISGAIYIDVKRFKNPSSSSNKIYSDTLDLMSK